MVAITIICKSHANSYVRLQSLCKIRANSYGRIIVLLMFLLLGCGIGALLTFLLHIPVIPPIANPQVRPLRNPHIPPPYHASQRPDSGASLGVFTKNFQIKFCTEWFLIPKKFPNKILDK